MTAQTKHEKLRGVLAGHGPVLVACSGGVDSTLLAVVAKEVFRKNTRCVLFDSPLVPRNRIRETEALADQLGLGLDIIPVPLLRDEAFCKNPQDRCYRCWKITAGYLRRRAAELGLSCIADGMNVSDTSGHRPGLAAATEEGVVHPYIEAGITKQDIRNIARNLGLPVWQKPPDACLASRIPYGDGITEENLNRIEAAEAYLAGRGIGQLRVRLHGSLARIEVQKEDTGKIEELRHAIVRHFRSLGFAYVTLDLEGYRSGSMDEVPE